MKGRKPALSLIEGDNAPRLIPAAASCPKAPAWLSEHGKREWKRAAPELQRRRLLYTDSLATLESYCVAVGTIRECEETMSRDGRLLDTEDGPQPHPAFKMQMAAMREARLLAAEMGLTPHRRGAKAEDKATGEGSGWASDLLA